MKMIRIGEDLETLGYDLFTGEDANLLALDYGLLEYNCFLCLVDNGDIEEIWGTEHSVPWSYARYDLLFIQPFGLVTESNTPVIEALEKVTRRYARKIA